MNSPQAFNRHSHPSTGLSAHVGFNKRLDLVMVGSVYSNVQSSTHIRPRQQLECNGIVNKQGHLQNFDLKNFGYQLREMEAVLRYVRNTAFFDTEEAIAYRIFHYVGDTRVIHGVFVTDSHHNLLRRFDREDLGLSRSGKSSDVLDFCEPYLSHKAAPASRVTN